MEYIYPVFSARLEEMFPDIEYDAIEDLEKNCREYRCLLDKLRVLRETYPFLLQFFEESGEITLSAQERAALTEHLYLLKRKEMKERRHLYFLGHGDAISYLKKTNVL